MMIVQRTFNLIDDKKDEFLSCLDAIYPDLESDPYIQTFAVVVPEETNSTVMVRIILQNDAAWEERMQLDYVKAFLARTAELVESIDTRNDVVMRFYNRAD